MLGGQGCFLRGLRRCDFGAARGETVPFCTQSAQEEFQIKGHGGEMRKGNRETREGGAQLSWSVGSQVGG